MHKSHKELAKEELEKLYDNKFRWIQAGKALRNRFELSLDNNPKIKWILVLSFFSGISIWLTFALSNF